MLKALADGFTADSIEPILDNRGTELRSLFRDAPVFFSDVYGDASGVVLADVPAGTYVLMWRSTVLSGLHLAAQIDVTGVTGVTTP